MVVTLHLGEQLNHGSFVVEVIAQLNSVDALVTTILVVLMVGTLNVLLY